MGFFLPYTLVLGTLMGVWSGGVFVGTGFFLLFGATMVLDEVIKDRLMFPPSISRWIYHDGLAQAAVNLGFPFLLAFLGLSIWRIATFNSFLETAGAVLSVGMVFGIMGLNISHENMHSRQKWHRGMAQMTLALINFCWMRTAHIDLHHRLAGTKDDFGTARKDESIYAFCWRHYSQGLKRTIQFEFARGGFGLRNRLWQYFGMGLGAGVLVFLLGALSAPEGPSLTHGGKCIVIWVCISMVAKTMLGILDYIQHKGLLRNELPNQRYETFGAEHSWECNFLVTNLGLFNLGHHAHHHQKASLEFIKLTALPDSPRLPHGYAMMTIKSCLGLW